ncbi:MAG: PCP reductase family protein [Gemmatimonadota bacterium]
MKFLCIGCDVVMQFAERQLPGDGTMAAVFTCDSCRREVAMLTNPMETQLVSSLGIRVGGRTVPEQPMELVRGAVATGGAAFDDIEQDAGDRAEPLPTAVRVVWSAEANERLARVPSFVRGMVRRIYTDYARERGIADITTDVMDRARTDLGLEGM